MAKPKKKAAKKREKKVVPSGHAYIQATFNNTIVTISDKDGNVVCWSSAGISRVQRFAQRNPVCFPAGGSHRCEEGP